MKKLIPVLLSLLMALAMTATALAATVYTEGALHYTIADESITITGYFGKDAAVTVPASIAPWIPASIAGIYSLGIAPPTTLLMNS